VVIATYDLACPRSVIKGDSLGQEVSHTALLRLTGLGQVWAAGALLGATLPAPSTQAIVVQSRMGMSGCKCPQVGE
jgi:hypothetical protein